MRLEISTFVLKVTVKSGLEFFILKFSEPIQRYPLTCWANLAFQSSSNSKGACWISPYLNSLEWSLPKQQHCTPLRSAQFVRLLSEVLNTCLFCWAGLFPLNSWGDYSSPSLCSEPSLTSLVALLAPFYRSNNANILTTCLIHLKYTLRSIHWKALH